MKELKHICVTYSSPGFGNKKQYSHMYTRNIAKCIVEIIRWIFEGLKDLNVYLIDPKQTMYNFTLSKKNLILNYETILEFINIDTNVNTKERDTMDNSLIVLPEYIEQLTLF